MIIEVDKEQLYRSITVADSVVSTKNINTILSNCLFNVSRDEIEIISTDNEIGIRTRLDAVTEGDISFTASGKRFASILKELPLGQIIINISDSYTIDIKTKQKDIKAHYTLVGTSKEDYPEVPGFHNEDVIELNQEKFKDMLKKVIHAAATDSIKPVFNGVYMISENSGKITAVSTDSRRLALVTHEINDEIVLPEGIIIPLKTVNELVRLLSTGSCYVSFLENQCFFKIGETEIISRIVDGQFPNYKQVIPQENSINAVIDIQRFSESIRRAMVFTREPANKVVLHFNGSSLVIEAKTPDLGESEEEIEIESDNDERMDIGINAQFLMDSLKEVDEETVCLGITGQMSPVTITPEKNGEFLSVVMPIQIKSD